MCGFRLTAVHAGSWIPVSDVLGLREYIWTEKGVGGFSGGELRRDLKFFGATHVGLCTAAFSKSTGVRKQKQTLLHRPVTGHIPLLLKRGIALGPRVKRFRGAKENETKRVLRFRNAHNNARTQLSLSCKPHIVGKRARERGVKGNGRRQGRSGGGAGVKPNEVGARGAAQNEPQQPSLPS